MLSSCPFCSTNHCGYYNNIPSLPYGGYDSFLAFKILKIDGKDECICNHNYYSMFVKSMHQNRMKRKKILRLYRRKYKRSYCGFHHMQI